MHVVIITCTILFVVFILLFWQITPKEYDSYLSASSATSTTWATIKCTETLYNTYASAQKASTKAGDFVSNRGSKFTVCSATVSIPPPCPISNCPACPACNCPAQKDCPACNCPAQKDCPACNCPACPEHPACPACNCPALQPQPIEILLQGNVTPK